VKRWLEDQIGGALTDLLAGASPARLRIIRLAEDAGKIAATLEPMAERAPEPGPYVLEGALDLATSALEPAVAQAAAAVVRIRPRVERARSEASGELRYYVDELGSRLDALEQLFGVSPLHDPDDDDEESATRRRPTKRRIPRAPASREALIAGIAESMLFERSLPTLLDPDAHAVTVTISRIGSNNAAAGLYYVTQSLAQSAWFDDGAATDSKGNVVPLDAKLSKLFMDTRDVTLVLRGLFVRAALATDHGTWMLRAAAAEPDIVRCEVRGGTPRSAADALRNHLAARRELDRVLEAGGALPPNPDVLLPVTRTITYRAPLRPGESYAIEVENFATGWLDRGTAKDIPSAVRRAWHLAWSKRP
jgi:hypothetical protein